MKITYLKTIGFRKFEQEFETGLYDVTKIIGKNSSGKSNILYAIVWAFLGTNLTGDDKVWLGNKNSDNCYVELKFIDNSNKEHTLIRYKNKYDNKENFVTLDNKKAELEDLQAYYFDKKLFLSILNPSYFITKKPAEQKELLDKYLPEIDISSVYEKIDKTEKKLLEGVPQNITEYIKELNSNKKMYEDKIKTLYGKIEYAENIVNMPIETLKKYEKEDELSLARQELAFLTLDKSSIDKTNQEKVVIELTNQIEQIQEQINSLSIKMQTGKRNYLIVKNEPVSQCSLCGQAIKNESKLIALKNMKLELEEMFLRKTKLEQDLIDIKSKLAVEKCKLYALDGTSEMEKQKQIANIELQINNLEQEKSDIEKHNNSIIIQQSNKNKAKEDIRMFNTQIHENETLIKNITKAKEIAQKLYIDYIEEKMQFANQYLKNVKIKYYSILRDTGEIKSDFIITYKDTELKNLSRSETIATSLELSNMFNKISKVNLPLFIDDSESCADYDFIGTYSKEGQILIAKVEQGQELNIQDSYAKEDTYLQVA